MMMGFFVPELVEVTMAERRRDARAVYLAARSSRRSGHHRLRQRLASVLGVIALSIHAEAARTAVGLCCSPDPTQT